MRNINKAKRKCIQFEDPIFVTFFFFTSLPTDLDSKTRKRVIYLFINATAYTFYEVHKHSLRFNLIFLRHFVTLLPKVKKNEGKYDIQQ